MITSRKTITVGSRQVANLLYCYSNPTAVGLFQLSSKLHTTRPLNDQSSNKHNQREDTNPNDPRSPLSIFRETFKKEWQKSAELQDNIKALQDASGRLGESEAYKKAREAYLKAQKGSTIVGKTLKKTGEAVEDMAIKAWDSEIGKTTRKAAVKTAQKIDETLEPVRQTKIYKDVSEVIDDGSSSSYGGFITKEERRQKRAKALATGERIRAVKSNDEAGTALVATNIEAKESIGKKMEDFKEKTVVGRSLHSLKVKICD